MADDSRVSFLLVGVGGAVGSMLRYAVATSLSPSRFPVATLVVNAAGCLLIGMALPGWDRAPILSAHMRLLFVVGVLGGFTTFSAFGHETAVLLERAPLRAILNVLANVGIGLAAVLIGRSIVLRWLGP